MSRLLVSLLVPTFNRAAELRESLKSTCGQQYEPLEILISDNESTDETEQFCRELAARDSRVRYFRHAANIGLYANHNFLIDQSRGEFLCFFHDHDERDLGIVREYVTFLTDHPEVGVVCSNWDLIDTAGRQIGVRDYPAALITPGLAFIEQTIRSGQSAVGAPGAMIRRSALGPVRFDEHGPIGFGDFVVWFQIAERYSIGHINRRLWRWRQHQQSQSARTIESLTRDYDLNLNKYCDQHLARWPRHASLVERWRRLMRRYLFWALAFEVGLHFRSSHSVSPDSLSSPTLFEILGYRLNHEQFEHARRQLGMYRTGVDQYVAHHFINALICLRVTWPLVWITQHYSAVRALLGLR